MARRERMTDDDLAALVDAELQDAIRFDETELSADRVKALEYERGEMKDTPNEEGRSSVVSFDVRDTIDWIMPGLMRVFLSTDRVGIYQPGTARDVEAAKQATDLVNYVFLNECDGFHVLYDAFHDALSTRNGYVKHWWDDSEHIETQTLSNLSPDQMVQVLVDPTTLQPDPTIEVLEQSEGDDPGTLDVKIKRTLSRGRLRVMAVPPEEILVNDGATDWSNVRFVAHRPSTKTRSDLVREGYDKDAVYDIPTYTDLDLRDEKRTRLERGWTMSGEARSDPSMETVEFYECYIRADVDGDGVAEWRRCVTAGPSGGRKLLASEEWDDELPFSDLRTGRVPHRWQGRSVFDLLQDIQRIKTVLWRQSLDNLYVQNFPQRAANLSRVKNPDALFSPRLGGVVDTDDPAGIQTLSIPFVAKDSLAVIDILDSVIEMRTGVSRQTTQLDPEALQNQTAALGLAAMSAAYARIEMIARMLRDGGMKRVFTCLLKLIVKHQDRPRTVRLRDDFVEMDPRTWNANMDCRVNTGRVTGSRDRDMAVTQQIIGIQQGIIGRYGFSTPLVTPQHHYNALAKFVEATGAKDVDLFFGEMTPEASQALVQQSQQNPEMAAAQAKMQMQAQEMQGRMQMEGQKAQMQMAVEREKATVSAQAQEASDQRSHEREMARIQAEIDLKRYQIDAELALKREQLTAELQLKRELAAMQAMMPAANGADATSSVHMGGDPG